MNDPRESPRGPEQRRDRSATAARLQRECLLTAARPQRECLLTAARLQRKRRASAY